MKNNAHIVSLNVTRAIEDSFDLGPADGDGHGFSYMVTPEGVEHVERGRLRLHIQKTLGPQWGVHSDLLAGSARIRTGAAFPDGSPVYVYVAGTVSKPRITDSELTFDFLNERAATRPFRASTGAERQQLRLLAESFGCRIFNRSVVPIRPFATWEAMEEQVVTLACGMAAVAEFCLRVTGGVGRVRNPGM